MLGRKPKPFKGTLICIEICDNSVPKREIERFLVVRSSLWVVSKALSIVLEMPAVQVPSAFGSDSGNRVHIDVRNLYTDVHRFSITVRDYTNDEWFRRRDHSDLAMTADADVAELIRQMIAQTITQCEAVRSDDQAAA